MYSVGQESHYHIRIFNLCSGLFHSLRNFQDHLLYERPLVTVEYFCFRADKPKAAVNN